MLENNTIRRDFSERKSVSPVETKASERPNTAHTADPAAVNPNHASEIIGEEFHPDHAGESSTINNNNHNNDRKIWNMALDGRLGAALLRML